MREGTGLLELMVVVAIISTLSLIGVNSINSFRNAAALDNVVNELLSDIRVARNKSMNGELNEGESVADFTSDGLPEYGISINSDSYSLVRKCMKIDGSVCESDPPITTTEIPRDHTLSPNTTFFFDRLSGSAPNTTLKVSNKSSDVEIEIIENGMIKLNY